MLGVFTWANTRISALNTALRSLNGGDESQYSALLRQKLALTARRVLREVGLRKTVKLPWLLTVVQTDVEPRGNKGEDAEAKGEYELLFCRPHMLCVRVV